MYERMMGLWTSNHNPSCAFCMASFRGSHGEAPAPPFTGPRNGISRLGLKGAQVRRKVTIPVVRPRADTPAGTPAGTLANGCMACPAWCTIRIFGRGGQSYTAGMGVHLSRTAWRTEHI